MLHKIIMHVIMVKSLRGRCVMTKVSDRKKGFKTLCFGKFREVVGKPARALAHKIEKLRENVHKMHMAKKGGRD